MISESRSLRMVASGDVAILVSLDAGERPVHRTLPSVDAVTPGRLCNLLSTTLALERVRRRGPWLVPRRNLVSAYNSLDPLPDPDTRFQVFAFTRGAEAHVQISPAPLRLLASTRRKRAALPRMRFVRPSRTGAALAGGRSTMLGGW
jgi:hypothetical protein